MDYDREQNKVTSHTETLRTDANGLLSYAPKARLPKPKMAQALAPIPGMRGIICCDMPEYDLAYATLNPAEDTDLVLKLFARGQPWSGRVVDENQKPIAGAKVTVGGLRRTDGGQFASVSEMRGKK